jgi:multimeric flavodoxin WrbA
MSEETRARVQAWAGGQASRILVLSSSPRRDGNSRALAKALVDGAQEAGHDAVLVDLVDHVTEMMRDCRKCRSTKTHQCTIEDGHRSVFLDLFLDAEAVVYATPIWWYGISAQLKAFIDRIFCYISKSEPLSDEIVSRLMGKKAALLLSAEESNFAARQAITIHFSELCRYLNHDFVGIVTGIGNRRGEVERDPGDPLTQARILGARMLNMSATDYKLDTDRPGTVWQNGAPDFPAIWR